MKTMKKPRPLAFAISIAPMVFALASVSMQAMGADFPIAPGVGIETRSELARFRDDTENSIGPGRMTSDERRIVALRLAMLHPVATRSGIRIAMLHRVASRPRIQTATNSRQCSRPAVVGLPISCLTIGDASDAYRNAISNFNRTSGSVTWNGTTTNGTWADSQNTYCARFVRMCFGKSAEFSNAINTFYSFNQRGVINIDPNPPLGAVVFYASGVNGHIGIADGAGSVYAVATRSSGVTRSPVLGTARAGYLGYVTADTFVKYYASREPIPVASAETASNALFPLPDP